LRALAKTIGQPIGAHCQAKKLALIERGWLVMHESGTFVRFTQAGADLFA